MDTERLNRIFGLGPKKLLELKRYYGVRNVTTLRNYLQKFPDLLTDTQKIGLKYYKYLKKKIPYSEAEQHMKYITKYVKSAVPTGSFRREVNYLNDLDIIILIPIDEFIEFFKKKKYIIEILQKGDCTASVIVLFGENIRQLDIFYTKKSNLCFMLFYTTGNKLFNIYTRKLAKKLGYVLSQNGLMSIKTEKYVSTIHTEKDIFKFLKIDYVEPINRELVKNTF